MAPKILRKIVEIDEDKCDGCGNCVIACAEHAISITNGKARLISESYCDGLGACLGECPQGAITIKERESDAFDEEEVNLHLKSMEKPDILPCGCPASIEQCITRNPSEVISGHQESMLTNWPVHISLVRPDSPFFKQADLLLAGDCVPFAYAEFHQDFINGRAVVFGCPKLDDAQAHLRKLTEIIKISDIRSLTVVHMEIPCCTGLLHIARQAIAASGKDVPLREICVSIEGKVFPETVPR